MKIIPYDEKYRRQAEEICIATASERARTDAAYGQFTLWMYCDPYLDGGTAYLLTEDDGRPAGYILCAQSYGQYLSFMRPYAEKIRGLGTAYEERMKAEQKEYEQYSGQYPAHLHIDLLDSASGRGYGTLLLQKLLSVLRADGVRGIMLGVSSTKPAAIRFYRKNGFEIIASDPYGCTMGIDLEERK